MPNLRIYSYKSNLFFLSILFLSSLLLPAILFAHSWSFLLGYTPPEPGTYELPVIKPATDGEVIDTAGRKHRLFDYMEDKIVLLSFIYTRCSDAHGCPLATSVLYAINAALKRDPLLSQQAILLTLSFDPEHDTPEVIRRYGGVFDTGKPSAKAPQIWHQLTTSSLQALQPILDGYGQYIIPDTDAHGRFLGTYSHLLKVFLIDQQRRVRNIYSVDFLHPQILMNDIKTLLLLTDQRAQVK